MTSNLHRLHQELFEIVSQSGGRLRQKKLTSFAALRGTKDSGGLMVVGRAVNGWTPDFIAKDLCGLQLKEILTETFALKKQHDNKSLLWVSDCWGASDGYNTKRSAFWRVTRSTVDQLKVADIHSDGWPSFISWSNLYKISPATGGNPSATLMGMQRDKCLEILKEEVSIWEPRRILFLTGLLWAKPFLEKLEYCPASVSSKDAIEARGSIFNGAKIVVSPHPQCKPEKPLISSIKTAFESLN